MFVFKQPKSICILCQIECKFEAKRNNFLLVHHPTIHSQIHLRPLSSCSQSQLLHAIHERSISSDFGKVAYINQIKSVGPYKTSLITFYIKSSSRFVPSNRQHHPILRFTQCTSMNLRRSRRTLAIEFIGKASCRCSTFTLQRLQKLSAHILINAKPLANRLKSLHLSYYSASRFLWDFVSPEQSPVVVVGLSL